MPVFRSRFTVNAPVESVRAFHAHPKALELLTPPGARLRLEQAEPVADGSRTAFTLQLGPLRIRWVARHRDVGPDGFTDVQEHGPMALWEHRHRFRPREGGGTVVEDVIRYRYPRGARGLRARLLFNPISLRLLFAWRAHATRRALRQAQLREGRRPSR